MILTNKATWSLIPLIVVGIVTITGCSHSLVTKQQVTWTGDVDDKATVNFQAGKSWIDDASDKGVENVAAVFQGSLPSANPVQVQLTQSVGRGQIQLVQQPTVDNNYTTAVRVIDTQPDKGHYQFVLTW